MTSRDFGEVTRDKWSFFSVRFSTGAVWVMNSSSPYRFSNSGAKLGLDSRPGRGSESAPTEAKGHEPGASCPVSVTEDQMARLVIIDDDFAIQDLLRVFFEDLHHSVACFESLSTGLEYLRSNGHETDLVICDLRLPDGTGLS